MKDKEFRPLLDDDWKKIKAKSVFLDLEDDDTELIWNYYISEPFPITWPPKKDTNTNYYIYGEGQDLNNVFSDGVYVSAPWMKIEYNFRINKIVEKNILCEKLSILGVQGIRPMDGHEIGIFDHAISIGKYLLTAESERSTKHLKNYYCLWIKHHKVLMKSIIPNHKDFINWLGCK